MRKITKLNQYKEYTIYKMCSNCGYIAGYDKSFDDFNYTPHIEFMCRMCYKGLVEYVPVKFELIDKNYELKGENI